MMSDDEETPQWILDADKEALQKKKGKGKKKKVNSYAYTYLLCV
jgi:hypothetical protein